MVMAIWIYQMLVESIAKMVPVYVFSEVSLKKQRPLKMIRTFFQVEFNTFVKIRHVFFLRKQENRLKKSPFFCKIDRKDKDSMKHGSFGMHISSRKLQIESSSVID